MEMLKAATNSLLLFTMIVLAVAIFFCLLRALLGPRFTDRIIAVNLIGTKTIILICALAIYMAEQYLVDVALVYALISFLAVVVLVNIYLSTHKRKMIEIEKEKQEAQNEGPVKGEV